MPTALTIATADEAGAVAALRNAVADTLTARHGIGHWSSRSTERGICADMRRSSVYLLRERGVAIATLQLATKKPWAIDRRFLTPVNRPLYLLGMAVEPSRQGTGVGRRCIDEAVKICREWPADSLCLDAYDADAGAGGFYRKCGFTEVGRATYRHTALIYSERLMHA
jgi:GNAT superfamily N-acetyltransferase